MANMLDYLTWRGDLTFEERAFNDVDNLVLSTFAYLDMTGIVPSEQAGGSVRMRDACDELLRQANGDVAPFVRSLAKVSTSFVELVCDSRRYGDARLCYYTDVVDPSRSLQFCALTIELPHEGIYVSYRGTDSTLVGWRENFMLSFEVTEAQREATRYLARTLRTANPLLPVRVGGHSKGGNLAEYAAANCPRELASRIVRVYSNDGPGMAPEVCPKSSNEVLGQRLRRIVPSYSVVGMIFARPDDTRVVVASSETGISQHDPTSWQVLREGMDEVGALQADCVVLNQAIALWAEGLSLEERRQVTNEVFDALGAGGAQRLAQIAESPDALQKVLRALNATGEQTRDVAAALVQSAINSSVGAMRDATHTALEDTIRRLRRAR